MSLQAHWYYVAIFRMIANICRSLVCCCSNAQFRDPVVPFLEFPMRFLGTISSARGHIQACTAWGSRLWSRIKTKRSQNGLISFIRSAALLSGPRSAHLSIRSMEVAAGMLKLTQNFERSIAVSKCSLSSTSSTSPNPRKCNEAFPIARGDRHA